MSSPNGAKPPPSQDGLLSLTIQSSSLLFPYLKDKKDMPSCDDLSDEDIESIIERFASQGVGLNVVSELYFHLGSVLAHAERVVAAKKQREILLGTQVS